MNAIRGNMSVNNVEPALLSINTSRTLSIGADGSHRKPFSKISPMVTRMCRANLRLKAETNELVTQRNHTNIPTVQA
jgi:hypothetical protein